MFINIIMFNNAGLHLVHVLKPGWLSKTQCCYDILIDKMNGYSGYVAYVDYTSCCLMTNKAIDTTW